MSGDIDIDLDRLEEVASRLDLRKPNREALESLAFEMSQHFDVDGRPAPFECVIDSATGVGKTYILLGGIEYFAARGMRNFAVIAPGSTIRDKTVAHFTAGDRKSLLEHADSKPVLITIDNFNTPAIKEILDDDSKTKVYVFTVQSLTAPTTNQGRRVRRFQESLGDGLYQHLAGLDDLTVFADEHHCYSGPAFSAAINDLNPRAIVGLTATPDPATPTDQIIYRYPLAAAIAERYVKTPVIVARKDDRRDSLTKLSDGAALLEYKAEQAESYCAEHGLPGLNPVMLIVAQNTADANEYAEILRSSEFRGGRYADAILLVHSNLREAEKQKALAALDAVEDPGSPVRIIISVGMLKEGWDVKNVYVIASMRASVSNVLTEQTLGRGLRLPFGKYTDIELLDTVEVLAHERYEQLLRGAGVLNEQFIDSCTRAVLRRDSKGRTVSVTETETVEAPVAGLSGGQPASFDGPDLEPAAVAATIGGAAVESLDQRSADLAEQTKDLEVMRAYAPLDSMPGIEAPVLRMTKVAAKFSLADITDFDPFTKLGTKIRADPELELRRMRISAKVTTGPDGMRKTALITTRAADTLNATMSLLPLIDLRKNLIDAVLNSPVVPPRPSERHAVQPLIDAFMEGLGDNAEQLLSAYGDRAAARLVAAVTAEHRRWLSAPTYEDVVELHAIDRVRHSKRREDLQRTGPFAKQVAYDSWRKSLYGYDWFDSKPERDFANVVDDSDDVECWVRLQVKELPILWRADGREYNADFVVIEGDGTHWVAEVKADYDITSYEVQAKRKAAQRWANHVNISPLTSVTWRYLLLSETDIKQAQGSWSAMKAFGV